MLNLVNCSVRVSVMLDSRVTAYTAYTQDAQARRSILRICSSNGMGSHPLLLLSSASRLLPHFFSTFLMAMSERTSHTKLAL
jgi:hypothetical protein